MVSGAAVQVIPYLGLDVTIPIEVCNLLRQAYVDMQAFELRNTVRNNIGVQIA